MLGQVSNNVSSARAWFDKTAAQQASQRTVYDNFLFDAFSREGVTRSSQIDDAKFEKVAKQLGVTTDGLLSAMGGRCPFGGGLQKATAKPA